MTVRCYSKPVIGILSTGNELVNPWETPVGTQIRDSNRATLLAAFTQDGYKCVDLGMFHITHSILSESNLNYSFLVMQITSITVRYHIRLCT